MLLQLLLLAFVVLACGGGGGGGGGVAAAATRVRVATVFSNQTQGSAEPGWNIVGGDTRDVSSIYTIMAGDDGDSGHCFCGGPSGARTPDRRVKSPLLCQLS